MTRRAASAPRRPDAPPPTRAPLSPKSTEPAAREGTREAGAEGSGPVISGPELDAVILRFLRRSPNQAVDLAPLAAEIGVDPFRIQLAVEHLHRRGMVVAPFIEPGSAGAAELTEKGLRWLIEREGGKPTEVPVALQLAKDRVRSQDEAARLPRAQVYGIKRP